MKTVLYISLGATAVVLLYLYAYPRIKAAIAAREVRDVTTGVETQIGAFALNTGENILKKVGGALGA